MTAKSPSKRASESRARRISNKGRQRVEAFIEPAAAAYLARVKAETGVSWSEQINKAVMRALAGDALLREYNHLVQAIGSPTQGEAAHYASSMRYRLDHAMQELESERDKNARLTEEVARIHALL